MNNQCLSPTKENAKNMQNGSRMMLYSTVKKWMVGGVSREAAAGLRGLKRRLLRCKSAEKRLRGGRRALVCLLQWRGKEVGGSSCYLNFALTMTIIMILDYLDMVSERHRET